VPLCTGVREKESFPVVRGSKLGRSGRALKSWTGVEGFLTPIGDTLAAFVASSCDLLPPSLRKIAPLYSMGLPGVGVTSLEPGVPPLASQFL
jgi:hypothetical protein